VEPTPQQAAVMGAFNKPGAKITVRSGHGVGKSCLLSWLIMHYLLYHKEAKVLCTAPTSNQMFDVLWAEIAKWMNRMPDGLRGQLQWHSDWIGVSGRERVCFATARTARRENPEALQGLHERNLMLVVDEASGVDDKIFEVGEGALTGENTTVVLMSNPTKVSGYFYDTHTKWEGWDRFKMSCVDSPLVSKKYVENIKQRYGEASNIYRVRVLGEFPISGDDALIPLDWVQGALGRDIVTMAMSEAKVERVAGLDVARYGDDASSLVVRQGKVISHLKRWRGADLMETVGRVVSAWRDENIFDHLFVDVIGMGAGVYDRLKEVGVPCTAVNVGETSALGDRFNRLRDELWWKCREYFEGKTVRIESSALTEDLIGELTGVTYKVLSSTGKIKVEGKQEMKNRGVASPDMADALCLTFAQGVRTRESSVAQFRPVEVQSGIGWT
jgi:hypothetical protein